MRKGDLLFLPAVLLVAVILVFVLSRKPSGGFVVVTVDGALSGRYPLSEETSLQIEGADGGYNNLVIRDGQAFLEDADCPDLSCVKTGKISKEGQSIICLPHRVIVTVEGGEADDVDVFAR